MNKPRDKYDPENPNANRARPISRDLQEQFQRVAANGIARWLRSQGVDVPAYDWRIHS